MKPEAGNTVTVVWNRNSGRGNETVTEETITKVGRKWASFGGRLGSRFDLESGAGGGPFEIDGGDYSSPGVAFLTADAAEIWRAKVAAWNRLKAAMSHRYSVPDGITLEAIQTLVDQLERSPR